MIISYLEFEFRKPMKAMTELIDDEVKVLLNSQGVDVSMNPRFGKHCMYFQFKGTFDKKASELSTQAWTDEFEKNPDATYKHVWDCTNMKDFNYDAKKSWTDTLSKFENRIDEIYVVADSIIIRGAARLMTKFSRYDMKIFKTVAEMYAYAQGA